jgi:hypothetical protein
MSHQWSEVSVKNIISAITLTATTSEAVDTLRTAVTMNSTTARAAGTIAQHARATGKSVALSSAAKALTGYMFGDVLNPLNLLQSYGNLLRIVIGGACVVGGLYNYFHRHQNNKVKIEFALISHCARSQDPSGWRVEATFRTYRGATTVHRQ